MTTKQQLLKQQRDNNDEGYFNYCERCKKPKPTFLEEHHIIYKSERNWHPEINNARNKILLCSQLDNSCHVWYHDDKSRREHLIEERNLTELFGTDILTIK